MPFILCHSHIVGSSNLNTLPLSDSYNEYLILNINNNYLHSTFCTTCHNKRKKHSNYI